MPTRMLPSEPHLDHLRHQAKDLLRARAAREPAALQRIREFHPRFARASDAGIGAARFGLSDAQLAIAREYGFPSWVRLRAYVRDPDPARSSRPHHERIDDPGFRRAVELLDAGDAEGLRAHLRRHPEVVRMQADFEGENYFRHPTLLEFVAENPVRHGRLPRNIVEVAEVILDEGASEHRSGMDAALGLVAAGRVPRECRVQSALIETLCRRGADPQGALLQALGAAEFEAAETLLRCGARLDLPAAAALGRITETRTRLPSATPEERHRALALAAQHGHAEVVRLLLDAGEDPARYNPAGCHSHSTPLHQAAYHGHADVVRLLIERGADLEARDILHAGRPLEWARHAGRKDIEALLLARGGRSAEDAAGPS